MRARNSRTTSTSLLVILSLFLCNKRGDAFSLSLRRTTLSSRLYTERNDCETDSIVVVSSSSSIDNDDDDANIRLLRRRSFATSVISSMILPVITCSSAQRSYAEEAVVVTSDPGVQVVLTGEVKKLFNEGRAREGQGNIPAATRIYSKVTKIAPKFIYGWSNLGNTQVALGALEPAEDSYTTAINLCKESRQEEEQFGVPRCNDYYLLLLNRGTLRLNNSMPKQALTDLELSATLRGKPDALVLQNRARAREVNGYYAAADSDYTVAISMTSNEVTPIWLRSSMVKFQLGDLIGALDLIRRVETKFPEAPEVRAAVATILAAKGDEVGARRKLLEIPDRQRVKYVEDEQYVREVVAWPPKMIESLNKLTKVVRDSSGAVDI